MERNANHGNTRLPSFHKYAEVREASLGHAKKASGRVALILAQRKAIKASDVKGFAWLKEEK